MFSHIAFLLNNILSTNYIHMDKQIHRKINHFYALPDPENNFYVDIKLFYS